MLSSYRREISTTWVSYFIRGQIDRFIPVVPERLLPLLFQLMPQNTPALSKAPLVLSGKGIEYRTNHNVVAGSFFRENCVLAHFKFLSDFLAHVKEEVVRGEHYRRGAEYFRYAKAIAGRREVCLVYQNSHEFEGVGQLVELGLIRDIRELLSPGAAQQGRSQRKNDVLPEPAAPYQASAPQQKPRRFSGSSGRIV